MLTSGKFDIKHNTLANFLFFVQYIEFWLNFHVDNFAPFVNINLHFATTYQHFKFSAEQKRR